MFNTQPDEVQLTGTLAEFREALRAEIEAARRQESSGAIPLSNGRRIDQRGGGFQYVFQLENVLNLPGEAPGDLRVAGRPPIEVTVVAVEAMTIILSLPLDLGPFVPNASLQSNLTYLLRELIARIETLASRPNRAGERMLGLRPASGEPVSGAPPPGLNPEQASAVASSLGRDATFIWGPPGTGKTRTIGTIARELHRQGRPALIVSHTNIAVDQAILFVADGIDHSELVRGQVLRVGKPRDPRLLDHSPELLVETHVARRSAELIEQRDLLAFERGRTIERADGIARRIDICEWAADAAQDIPVMAQDIDKLRSREAALARGRAALSHLDEKTGHWAAAADEARKAKSIAGKLDTVNDRLREITSLVERARRKVTESMEILTTAESVLAETTSVGWLTRRWRRLPHPDEQSEVVDGLRVRAADHGRVLDEQQHNVREILDQRTGLAAEFEGFRHEYSLEPGIVLLQAESHAQELSEVVSGVDQLAIECESGRKRLETLLEERLGGLVEWGLAEDSDGGIEETLASIRLAYERATAELRGTDLVELHSERAELNKQLQGLEEKILAVDEALSRVEDSVIADAQVVATTLTLAYLRESIQARRFDTVILDEASMAPIPALWVAASLAERGAVVVGDPMQLPPIVLSDDQVAQKWLGRDVLELVESADIPIVKLRRQYRMHPDISAIPNKFFYDGDLLDDPSTNDDGDLEDWFHTDWGHDAPVLLVDTGPLDAWVTSVARGGRSSRLNFLSATTCTDLMERVLRREREELGPGSRARALIVCPYRPHAQLLTLLLRDQDLDVDVNAGTAHSFQGSEADVVILDLVNDEPHWKVGMFDPRRDENTKRLLNVALTRAKRRLYVVGDFDYILTQAKRAFLGDLVLFLTQNYSRISALEVVPEGFARRADEADKAVFGGALEPDSDRVVVTQEHFYPMLRHDLDRAHARVVIYSPFITESRLSQVQTQIRAAVERGVRVYVVTKALEDRPKRQLPSYRALEEVLRRWGVIVVHKRRMHEKLVFVDDGVLWVGSLNPLSFQDTQEIMERRASRQVASDFTKTLRLAELLQEYESGSPDCPICGSEIVASEGADKPFYWRCVVEGCYTRDIDQRAMVGGVMTCQTCGGTFEYGEWGSRPAWRCVENRRHHLRVARTHVQLPKMRRIVPRRELSRLDKVFGISRQGT